MRKTTKIKRSLHYDLDLRDSAIAISLIASLVPISTSWCLSIYIYIYDDDDPCLSGKSLTS